MYLHFQIKCLLFPFNGFYYFIILALSSDNHTTTEPKFATVKPDECCAILVRLNLSDLRSLRFDIGSGIYMLFKSPPWFPFPTDIRAHGKEAENTCTNKESGRNDRKRWSASIPHTSDETFEIYLYCLFSTDS